MMMYTRNKKTKRHEHIKTIAPYGAPNQSTKSSINKESSPIYNPTQSQNKKKKKNFLENYLKIHNFQRLSYLLKDQILI